MSPTPSSYNNYINTRLSEKKCSCFSSSNIFRPVNIGDVFDFWCQFAVNFQRLCRWDPCDQYENFSLVVEKIALQFEPLWNETTISQQQNPLGFRLPKCLLVSMLFYTTSGRPSLLITPRCERKSKIVQINGRKESVYCDLKKRDCSQSVEV